MDARAIKKPTNRVVFFSSVLGNYKNKEKNGFHDIICYRTSDTF